MNLAECINVATRAGYKVKQDDDGFWITTPKAPRQPSQELGMFDTERTAWVSAAAMALRFH